MDDANETELVVDRKTSIMNEYSTNEGEMIPERQTSTIKDGDNSKIK